MSGSGEECSAHELVQKCQEQLAHAWMVRTFVKHSEEAEDFPEIMVIARAVFDASMALESRVDAPEAYFKMLGKKAGKLRRAVQEFAEEAPKASTHTNFHQAVVSVSVAVDRLLELLAEWKAANAKHRDLAPTEES